MQCVRRRVFRIGVVVPGDVGLELLQKRLFQRIVVGRDVGRLCQCSQRPGLCANLIELDEAIAKIAIDRDRCPKIPFRPELQFLQIETIARDQIGQEIERRFVGCVWVRGSV